MKILFFLPVYAPAWQFGGPVLSVSRLCEGLAKKGLEIKVITTNFGLPSLPEKQLSRPTIRNGVQIVYYRTDQPIGSIQSKELVEALPELLKDIDLIHISAIWQPLGIAVQRQAWKQNIPVIHSLRGALGPYSRRQKWWKKYPYYLLYERPWLQRAAALHVTTRQEEHELRGLRLRSPRILLQNTLDINELQIDSDARDKFRSKHGISCDIPLLLICGRQHHKKGLDLVPRVLNKLNNYSWELVIVGEDDDGSGRDLILRLRKAGLGSRIHNLKMQPSTALNAIYNACDLLLLPSRHENFGNVVIEALACGCAVAISDKTGVGEDLKQDAPIGFGSVMKRENEIWRSWLEKWLNDPRRAGPEVAAWAGARYSIDTVSTKALEIYQSILKISPK